jgi:hypothetical protein
MSSNAFVAYITNGINDIRRDIIKEVLVELGKVEEEDAWVVEDLKTKLLGMISVIKPNKKITKAKKPRFSGYHLYMREHRVVAKAENPGLSPQEMTSLVAKSWKEVPEDKKQDYKDRAAKMKEESESDVSSDDSSDEAKPVKVPKENKEKVPKENKEKVPKAKVPKEKKADDSDSDSSVKAPKEKKAKVPKEKKADDSDSDSSVKAPKEKKAKVPKEKKADDSDSDSSVKAPKEKKKVPKEKKVVGDSDSDSSVKAPKEKKKVTKEKLVACHIPSDDDSDIEL